MKGVLTVDRVLLMESCF